MKYTERWSKSRRKMATGGQVTPGEQARDLAEGWRRATLQTSSSIPEGQLAPSLEAYFKNAETKAESIASMKKAQKEFLKKNPDLKPGQMNPDLNTISVQARQMAQEEFKKIAQQQREQKSRAAEMVTYKIRGTPFRAVGTKESRDRYIDDYNRKQQIAKLERQKAARKKR